MYFIYILKSKIANKYYIGSTNNIQDRLKRHNTGQGIFSKRYSPWTIVHIEKFLTRKEAYNRELKIKSYKSGEAFKKLLNTGGFA